MQQLFLMFKISSGRWVTRPDDKLESDSEQISNLLSWGLPKRYLSSVKVWVPSGSDTQVPNSNEFSLKPSQLSQSDWLAVLRLERYTPMGQALLALLNVVGPRTPGELASNCNDTVLGGFQQGTVDGLRWRLESFGDTQILGDVGLSVDELLAPRCLERVVDA